MDIGSFFLILALFILVGLFVARPFFENRARVVTRQEHEMSALLAERDRIINALQELDFDYQMGKIPEEDYPTERAYLLQTGAETLRRLDELQLASPVASAEDRIESAIRERRAERLHQPQTAGVPGIPFRGIGAQDDDLEALIASRRRAMEGRSGGFCPQCGNPVTKTDKFCPRCGDKL
jgi:hypothetical protein